MSTNAKIIMWLAVAVVIIGGIWWWIGMNMNKTAVAPTNSVTQNQAPVNSPTQTQTSTVNGPSATDNSNVGLQTDLSNIDSQMNGFSSDNTNVSQGMNDQSVQQASL